MMSSSSSLSSKRVSLKFTIHELRLVVLDLVRASHDLLNLLLVSHKVGKIVVEVLHLVHVQLLHLLLLDGSGLLESPVLRVKSDDLRRSWCPEWTRTRTAPGRRWTAGSARCPAAHRTSSSCAAHSSPCAAGSCRRPLWLSSFGSLS